MEEKLKESHSFGSVFPPPARAERKTRGSTKRERKRDREAGFFFVKPSVERCTTDGGNLFALGSVIGHNDTWQQTVLDRNSAGWGPCPDIIRLTRKLTCQSSCPVTEATPVTCDMFTQDNSLQLCAL